jgi:hypothetical protein
LSSRSPLSQARTSARSIESQTASPKHLARPGQGLDARRDVDRLAEDVASLEAHLAEMDSGADLKALPLGCLRVVTRDAALQGGGAEDGVGGRVEDEEQGAADLLDAAAAESAEDGVEQRLVDPQHPLALLPGLGCEPLGVAADAGEDDREVARAHACKLWPPGARRLSPEDASYRRFDSGATGAVGAQLQPGWRPMA